MDRCRRPSPSRSCFTRGESLAGRLISAFSDLRDGDQLVHIATDGESYGHHHPHGDMALASALEHLAATPGVTLTNYGEFLEKHPPQWEVEIFEDSSWSCVHGIERWRSSCGCNSGRPGWHQEWRGPCEPPSMVSATWTRPVRTACEGAAQRSLGRPQRIHRARPRPVSRSDRRLVRAKRPTNALGRRRMQAIKLLEMQRHALLMYTSCGWFFDEISGLETVQILQYAARLIQLAEETCERQPGARVSGTTGPRSQQSPSPSPDRPRGLREIRAALPARLAERRRPLRRRLALPVRRGIVSHLLLRRGPERRTCATRPGTSS